MGDSNWKRVRFYADPDDYRPVTWPPPGPYWCSGSGDDYSIVIAYVRTEEQVTEFWPEASLATFEHNVPIKFTDRFPRPDWWEGSADAN